MRVCPKCFSLFADQERCPQDGTATVHYTELLVGMKLGPYVVRSMISEGGMGVVYVGEHPDLGRRIALKVLRPELSLRDDIVERFVQEARAVNTIGHANIVNIYDFGRTPFGTFYIVMEYLEGRTLRALLDSTGPQPIERVRFIVDNIGAALAAAHDKSFIHRDVKPENVMVGHRSATEYAKLLDFGIAKLVSNGDTTATHSAMGTPQYMSPEQLDDAPLDPRSDIFSFGCVIYELLTGQVPFPGATHAGVRQAQLTRQAPPPNICRRDIHISKSIDAAVLKAIQLNPDLRQQTMDEFLDAFRAGYEETLREQVTGLSASGVQPKRRKILIISTAFAVLLGTVVALTVVLVSQKHATQHPPTAATRPANHTTSNPAAGTKTQPLPAAKKAARQKIDVAMKAGDRHAAEWAGIVGAEALRPALLIALTKPKSRVQAAYALDALGDLPPKTRAALRTIVAGPAGFAAIAAASTLSHHDNAEAKVKLHLQRKMASKVLQAQTALFELGRVDTSPKLAHAILNAARHTLSAKLKARGLGPLARRGNPQALATLRKTLKTGSDQY